jgi:hypothetical protein
MCDFGVSPRVGARPSSYVPYVLHQREVDITITLYFRVRVLGVPGSRLPHRHTPELPCAVLLDGHRDHQSSP